MRRYMGISLLGILFLLVNLVFPPHSFGNESSPTKVETTVISPSSWGEARNFLNIDPNPEKYLYVWAGNEDKTKNDFIAVVDVDKRSTTYGKVINTVDVGSEGNEPHQIAINHNKTTLAAASLSSGKIFFFDITNDPTKPKHILTYYAKWKRLAAPVVVRALPHHGFLVAAMGSTKAGGAGNILQFDDRGRPVRTGNISTVSSSINIGNLDYSVDDNIIITTDFTTPEALLSGKMDTKNNIRLWDYKHLTLNSTIKVGPGPKGVQLIPGTYKAYVSCFTDGSLWSVNLFHPWNTKKIMDYEPMSEKSSVMPTQMYVTKGGKRLIQSLYGQNKIVEYAIDINMERPLKISEVVAGQGPSSFVVTKDEKYLFASYHFMETGKTTLKGDNHIRLILMEKKGLFLDPTFDVDFNNSPLGPAHPGGMALY